MFFQKNAILIAPNFVSYCGVRRNLPARSEAERPSEIALLCVTFDFTNIIKILERLTFKYLAFVISEAHL